MITMQVEEINRKFIMLNEFIKSRGGTRTKAAQDLMQLQSDETMVRDLQRNKGLKQLKESDLLDMALSDTPKWSEIWRNVKKLDIDNNGFIEQ